MTTSECIQFWATIITGFGVFVTLIAFIWQTGLTREQMKLNFFADYTKRYQEIILNFPENINEQDFNFEVLDAEIKAKTLRYMRAYFDLCSEEYYLHREGKIDTKVWEEWEGGIKFTFSKKAFKDAWKIINLDSKFYKEFMKWVNNNFS
ncbi:hypothetical protein [Saccharicrinis sp. FJH54]|uniref:hypothetical protein n=1 Tax=Saccharicrinis sp. FJH54 TaxID=3344665 RepID=UPI0035D4E8BF